MGGKERIVSISTPSSPLISNSHSATLKAKFLQLLAVKSEELGSRLPGSDQAIALATLGLQSSLWPTAWPPWSDLGA